MAKYREFHNYGVPDNRVFDFYGNKQKGCDYFSSEALFTLCYARRWQKGMAALHCAGDRGAIFNHAEDLEALTPNDGIAIEKQVLTGL